MNKLNKYLLGYTQSLPKLCLKSAVVFFGVEKFALYMDLYTIQLIFFLL
jgi:hypothetical protein